MIVIILAAGKGTRLGTPFPKTLTNLKDGKSILLHQLDGLYRYIRREDIFVVVGYKKELIKQAFPDLHYINNEKYNETNTSQSLLIALNQFSKKIEENFKPIVQFSFNSNKNVIRYLALIPY